MYLIIIPMGCRSAAFHPSAAGAGGVVEAFAGGGEEFTATIGDAAELAAWRACIARHPGAAPAGGIIHSFRGDGNQLVAIRQQVGECAAGGTAVACRPSASTTGGIPDSFGRDTQHLFSVVDQLWHNIYFLYIKQLFLFQLQKQHILVSNCVMEFPFIDSVMRYVVLYDANIRFFLNIDAMKMCFGV